MPLYVMLAHMNPHALARSEADEAAYNQQLAEPHQNGEVMDFYAVLGQYDFVIMAHAADIYEAARLSGEIALQMDLSIETLPALRKNLDEAPANPPMETAGVRQPNPPRPSGRPARTAVPTPAVETPDTAESAQPRRAHRSAS